MSKTFKSAVTITGSRNLLVSTDIGMDAGFFLEVRDKHEEPQAICFENRTAPALALAILEAAGVEESSDAGVAAGYLRSHMTELELATAEAEAQAKLEAEALALENARCEALQVSGFNSFDDLPAHKQMTGLAVARRAREMAKEDTK